MAAPTNGEKTTSNDATKAAGAKYARKKVEEMFKNSNILDMSKNYPKFDRNELTLGKVLGKGGFGTVYEVRGFATATNAPSLRRHTSLGDSKGSEDELQEGEMESRKFISEHCIRNGGDARYAVKFISQDVAKDQGLFLQAAVDMAVETRVLSDTMHPNIVKLRAIATVESIDPEYFIVMDRLYDTLEKRIEKWNKQTQRFSGLAGKLTDRKGNKKKKLLEEKLVAGFDLSAALDFLHKRNIIYRDLKPENIGFDIRDDIKIFDFGLAKELHKENKMEDGLYKLTGMTGSPRYMAPEVGNENPYNASCDTYSFAIVFWEMFSMKTPFELYTMTKLKNTVWTEPHKRPFVQDSWPLQIKSLLRRAWSKTISERPSMAQVYKILRNECVKLRDGDETGLEHERRRSTFVFRENRGTLDSTTSTEKDTKGKPAPARTTTNPMRTSVVTRKSVDITPMDLLAEDEEDDDDEQ